MYYPVLEISLKDGLWLTLTLKPRNNLIYQRKKAPIFSIYTKYECLKMFIFEPAIPQFATSLTIHRGKLSYLIESIKHH